MKRGLTLVELIFSMVIIAIAFLVLPKILQFSTKVSTQSLREEAMYSAISLLGLIRATAWDEKNSIYDDILIVNNGDSAYDCSSNGLRVGGFLGSRNCKNQIDTSALGQDSNEPPFDDVDDFGSFDANSSNSARSYKIDIKVYHIEDLGLNDEVFKNESYISLQSTNTKYIILDINSTKKVKDLRKNIARFVFYTYNIGQIYINRLPWYE